MNTFKRKALSCAILGGLGAVAGTAQAVYQNPNGLGQALIYPYYTVQTVGGNSFNTYLSIVNTTSQGKALKVRFREGKNSREVLDFNLYMSPNDVWTAAVVPADATTTSPARLLSTDASCTNPPIPTAGVDFRNAQYSGLNTDNTGTGLDRTREGYLEIIEMATLIGTALTGVTHGTNGIPANCAVVQVPTLSPAVLAAPTGGMAGTYTLINVANGSDMGGNAVALANFNPAIIYTDLGNEATNLTTAQPVSVVVAQQPTGTTVYTNTFTTGVDAVSSTIMHSAVINEYVLDTATRSNTDWVMTFPTKRYYTATAPVTTPFTNNYVATNGACEAITFNYFNREEQSASASAQDFSPSQGPTPDSLCWESTVLSIRNGAAHMPTGTVSGVLGSTNTAPVNIRTGFQNGWARLAFTGTNATTTGLLAATTVTRNVNTGTTSALPARFLGLPVVGFMARNLNNGTLTCTSTTGTANVACQGTYGSLFEHKYEQSITPAP
jgi:hypothetical protein